MIAHRPYLSLPLLAALAFAVPAAAKPIDPPTKQQQAQIAALLKSHTDLMLAAFKGEDALRATLERELKRIQALRDPKAMKAAIQSFQAKHSGAYRGVLAKAGINLNIVASQFNAIYPAFNFTVRDGIYLVGFARSSSPPAPPPAGPATTVLTLGSSDYTIEKDLSCGAITGSSVTYANKKIVNDTFAAEVGGCMNFGYMRYKFQVPAGQKARVELTGNASAETFALGLVAAALGYVSVAFGGDGDDGDYYRVSVHCEAMAPLFWAASESCSIENAHANYTRSAPGQAQVEGYTMAAAAAGGVVAASTAHTELKITNAKITIGP